MYVLYMLDTRIETMGGIWKIFDCEKHKQGSLGTCYGINDSTMYGFPVLLKSHDKSKLNPWFTLDDNEAIVIFGRTPYPCLYWGYTPYVHKRIYDGENKYTQVNASVADTFNMNTFKNKTHVSDTFRQKFVLVVGKNPTINERLLSKTHFKNYDVSDHYKFEMPLPSDLLQKTDYLTILSRCTYIVPKYRQKYMTNTDTLVFKMTIHVPKMFLGNMYRSNSNKHLVKISERDKRLNEKQLMHGNKTFAHFMEDIKRKFLDSKYTQVDVRLFSVTLDNPLIPIDSGFTCIKHRYDCFFDNNDTVYTVTRPIVTKDAPNGIIMVGVNHTNTKKATYTNLNIYDGEKFVPFVDILIRKDEKIHYLSNGILVENYIFFYKVTIPYKVYKKYSRIFLAERAYLQSMVSPHPDTIIFPMVFLIPF